MDRQAAKAAAFWNGQNRWRLKYPPHFAAPYRPAQ
jgi:hypothetical protein